MQYRHHCLHHAGRLAWLVSLSAHFALACLITYWSVGSIGPARESEAPCEVALETGSANLSGPPAPARPHTPTASAEHTQRQTPQDTTKISGRAADSSGHQAVLLPVDSGHREPAAESGGVPSAQRIVTASAPTYTPAPAGKAAKANSDLPSRQPTSTPAVQTVDKEKVATGSQQKTAIAQAPIWQYPQPLYTPALRYPPAAQRLKKSGRALLKVEIMPDGRPGQIELLASAGHATLDAAAMAGVRQWRFRPALRDGKAVACWIEIPVVFRMQ